MKVNIIMTILALVASALVGYAFHSSGCEVLHTVISTVLFAIFMVVGMGISLEQYPRSSMLIKVTCFVIMILTLILDIILIAFKVSDPTFVITNGLLAVAAFALCYMLYQSKQ
jgi:hypothetical protein